MLYRTGCINRKGRGYMNRKLSKRLLAAAMAAAMTAASSVSILSSLTASAIKGGELLGESTFDYKMLPWHIVEAAPARQDFKLEDGAVHITILRARGAENQAWDLQFRHRKLDFETGHTYKISFSAKSNRSGLMLSSRIGDTGEPYDEYFTLKKEGFVQGPHMGGGGQGWGEPVELSTEWQTWEGIVECTEDLKAKEWAFWYAYGERGNAQDGDEIWFDNMSVADISTGICKPSCEYYGTGRNWSGLENNFISVNQLGYFTQGAKTATLGDNKSYPTNYPYLKTIDLTKDSYTFELADTDGNVVYTGTTGKKFFDKDSQENVCKIDFSEYTTPGTYYLRIQDTDWRSFAFEIKDNPYDDSSHELLTDAINYFFQNRSGMDIEDKYITSGETWSLAHKGGHKTDRAVIQTEWNDLYLGQEEANVTYASSEAEVSGGWYESADHSKSMVEGGMAVWTLQNMYERSLNSLGTMVQSNIFRDGSGTCVVPETGNAAPDILDECRYELDFMAKMKVDASEPTWGELAGLYYHKVQDHKATGLATRPWNYEDEWETVRIIKPPTFAATLNYAACAAQGARLWQDYDPEYAANLMKDAKEAYQAFKKHYYDPDMKITRHTFYANEVPAEENNKTSQYAPLLQSRTSQSYGDVEVHDDAYWAACELYLTAKALGDADAAEYLKELSAYKDAFRVPARITGGENEDGDGSYTAFNWGNTAAAGSLSLALHINALTDAQKDTLNKSILETAQVYLDLEAQQGYSIPYQGRGANEYLPTVYGEIKQPEGFEYDSNARALSNIIVLAYAFDLTSDTEYLNGVTTGMDYLLGNNPLSVSYITGYGTYRVQFPSHRYWGYELDDTLPMAPDGVLTAGPTVDFHDPYMRGLGMVQGAEGNASEKCYIDSIEAYSCSAVSLSWNAELAWIAFFLLDRCCPPPPPPVTEPGTTPSAAAVEVWGDTDADGRTDVSDAVLLARYLTEDSEAVITDQGRMQANIVKGSLDSADLTAMLMLIAKKISYAQLPLDKLPS